MVSEANVRFFSKETKYNKKILIHKNKKEFTLNQLKNPNEQIKEKSFY